MDTHVLSLGNDYEFLVNPVTEDFINNKFGKGCLIITGNETFLVVTDSDHQKHHYYNIKTGKLLYSINRLNKNYLIKDWKIKLTGDDGLEVFNRS